MYAYVADVWCDDCAMTIINDLRANGTLNDGTTDTWPQRYGDNDESDCPQHCSHCHIFLENQLTDDGYDYVFESWLDKQGDAIQEWLDYYPELDLHKRCSEYIVSVHKGEGGIKACASHLLDLVKESQTYDPKDIDDGDGPGMDVRLRYFQGYIYVHKGDSSYDQDHRGFWGCSGISPDMDPSQCFSIAKDLLKQVLDHMHEIEDLTLLSDWMTE